MDSDFESVLKKFFDFHWFFCEVNERWLFELFLIETQIIRTGLLLFKTEFQ